MQHWILCISSWYCHNPFRQPLLKWVHQNLIRWISIIRLLRKSPTWTKSIYHLLLAVLVNDFQFWLLSRLKVPRMVVTKTLASVTTGLPIILPFRNALLTACGNRHFQTILESQIPSLSQRHGMLRSTLHSTLNSQSIASLQDSASWQTYQDFKFLVAASGRSCLAISFNICTITCAVASYVNYWFVPKCVDILVPNSWFGYRCRSLCSSSVLFCLCCTSSL